jgi:hypothetical protein
VVRTDPLAGLARLENLLGGTSGVATGLGPARPTDRPLPCRGPSCSGRDSVPLPAPAPAAVEVVRSEAWGLLASTPELGGPGSRFASSVEPPAHALQRRLPLDRPPRTPRFAPR